MTSDQEIIADFGSLMERSPPLPTRIEDVSALPHPKEAILTALVRALISNRYTEQMEEYLKIALTSLPQYQNGVGHKPIEILEDIDKFNRFEKAIADDMWKIEAMIAEIYRMRKEPRK
jgi:uncharacterized radical SAM superfamily Fe-S cluster-containing enzyme